MVSLSCCQRLCPSSRSASRPKPAHSCCPFARSAAHLLRIVSAIRVRRHITALTNRRVLDEKVRRLQTDRRNLHRHHGEVLYPRVMRHAIRVPHHEVLVPHILLPRGIVCHAINLFQRLIRPLASGPQIPVAVPRHPNMVLSEARPASSDGVLMREDCLTGLGDELEAHGIARDGIEDAFVDDFEAAVREGRGVRGGRFLDRRLDHAPGVSVRVLVLRGRDGDAVFLDDGVERAVDHGVDAHAEEVLVVCCEHAGRDYGAPVGGLAGVDRGGGDDAGCACFELEVAVLHEYPGPDVLVITDGDDGLHYQVTRASNGGIPGAVVGMLPPDPAVLFVETNYVLRRDRVAVVVVQPAGEVLDGAETVTAKGEIVRAAPSSCIA